MGRLILIIVIVGAVFAAGYFMGMYTRPSRSPKVTRPERQELSALRELKSSVRSLASSHIELDPNLSRIILDEVDKTDKAVDRARAS